jgi:hypothetical protein
LRRREGAAGSFFSDRGPIKVSWGRNRAEAPISSMHSLIKNPGYPGGRGQGEQGDAEGDGGKRRVRFPAKARRRLKLSSGGIRWQADCRGI